MTVNSAYGTASLARHIQARITEAVRSWGGRQDASLDLDISVPLAPNGVIRTEPLRRGGLKKSSEADRIAGRGSNKTSPSSSFLDKPARGPLQEFAGLLRRETLEAEQFLTGRVPIGSDPKHLLGKIFKPLGITGNIPARYTPSSAQGFDLEALLVKESDADLITVGERLDPALEKILYYQTGSRRFLRKFVHPLEVERAQQEYAPAMNDPVHWLATPSSSIRSLLITDQDKKFPLVIGKTSLGYVVGGIYRRTDRRQAQRAVQVSSYYDQMMEETRGRIPNTNKTWAYFREPAAVGIKGDESNFTIIRSPPPDYPETIYLPFYSLIGEREDGGRWIDELYQASGYRNKLAFVWNEIAKPLIEFYLMAHLQYGLIPELHQQNALARVDPITKKILGISVRDMDAHSIDYIARKHLVKLSAPPGGLNQTTSSTYSYLDAKQRPMLGYMHFKNSIFKNIMKFFLEPSDVRKLVGLSNQMMLQRFNGRYAAFIGTTDRFVDLAQSFQKLYAQILPAAEAQFFQSEEGSYGKSLSLSARIVKAAIVSYHNLKQRLERSELPSRLTLDDERVGPPPASTIGYPVELAKLDPRQEHTFKDLNQYLIDNLGAETVSGTSRASSKFLIFAGEAREALGAAMSMGWEILRRVRQRDGYQEIYQARNTQGEKAFLFIRVNGQDRILHIQSLLKLAGVPPGNVMTLGETRYWKQQYLSTFRRLSYVPDGVIYGFANTAVTRILMRNKLRNAKHLIPLGRNYIRKHSRRNTHHHDLYGLDMQIFEFENGKRLWLFTWLYGELAQDLMAALLEHGVDNISFVGTAGAPTPTRQVSQPWIPAYFRRSDGSISALNWLTPVPGIPQDGVYMHVRTPNIETKSWAAEAIRNGVDFIEVELGHILKDIPRSGVRFRPVLVVTDTLTGHNRQDMTEWNLADVYAVWPTIDKVLDATTGFTNKKDYRISRYENVPFAR